MSAQIERLAETTRSLSEAAHASLKRGGVAVCAATRFANAGAQRHIFSPADLAPSAFNLTSVVAEASSGSVDAEAGLVTEALTTPPDKLKLQYGLANCQAMSRFVRQSQMAVATRQSRSNSGSPATSPAGRRKCDATPAEPSADAPSTEPGAAEAAETAPAEATAPPPAAAAEAAETAPAEATAAPTAAAAAALCAAVEPSPPLRQVRKARKGDVVISRLKSLAQLNAARDARLPRKSVVHTPEIAQLSDSQAAITDKSDSGVFRTSQQPVAASSSAAGASTSVAGAHIDSAFTHDKNVELMMQTLQRERSKLDRVDSADPSVLCRGLRYLVIPLDSQWKRVWDVLVCLVVVFTCLAVPLQIAFSREEAMGDSRAWDGCNLFIDIFLLCDVALSFLTSHREDGREVFDPRRIARRYVRGPFLVDLVGSLPLSLLVPSSAGFNRLLRILRFSKLLRIVRMTRGIRLVEELTEINPRAVRLAKLFVSAIIFWHWFGCIYWAFEVTLHERNPNAAWARSRVGVDGAMGGGEGGCYRDWRHFLPPPGAYEIIGRPAESQLTHALRTTGDWGALDDEQLDAWAEQVLGGAHAGFGARAELVASLAAADEAGNEEGDGVPPECAGELHPTAYVASRLAQLAARQLQLRHRYLWAIYWVVSVSSGFNQPRPAESVLAAVLMVSLVTIGMLINALIIGSAASIVGELDEAASIRKAKMDGIKALLRQHRVGRGLRQRVLLYLDYLWGSQGAVADVGQLIEDLPYTLRLQLTMTMHKKLFTDVPLFRHTDTRIVCVMVQRMQPVISLPGEVILEEGCAAKGLFVLQKGQCDVLIVREKVSNRGVPSERQASDKLYAGAREISMVVVNHIVEGDFFGEVSLLTDRPSTATIIATEYCNLMVLLAAEFHDFLARFPELKEEMERCKDEQIKRYANNTVEQEAKSVGRKNTKKGRSANKGRSTSTTSTTEGDGSTKLMGRIGIPRLSCRGSRVASAPPP